MKAKTLHLLVLEDVPNDAELEIAELEQAGFTCEWQRVETREDFLAALEASDYDVILSDYALPSFDGLTALKLLQERKIEIPFILVSGTLGEDAAIESLTAGAIDYVLKTRLTRLAPVVERALLEQRLLLERKLAFEALKESEERLRMVLNSVDNLAIVTTDLNGEDTKILDFSAGAENMLGYTAREVLGQKVALLHIPQNIEKIPAMLQNLKDGKKRYDGEITLVRKSGERFPALLTIYPRYNAAGELTGTVGVSIDLTERKKAEVSEKKRVNELEQFNKMATGRELRMVELKKEVNALCRELGREEPYA